MGDDHRLGVIEFKGAEDASETRTIGARIEAMCDAAWSASENGARLDFYTTDANASESKVLTLDSDKLATFAAGITVAGALKAGNSGIVITDTTNSSATQGGSLKLIADDDNVLADNHRLGVIEFQSREVGHGTAGYSATGNIQTGARIQAIADATWSATENGTSLEFYTTDGNASESVVLTLDSNKLATFTGGITAAGTITGNVTGDLTGEAATVATIAGLAPNTATTQASQPNITGVGTIGTGVWEGTAIATDQQKHLIHYEFMGFNNSTADTVYEFAESMNDTKAPLEHTADHNATITTAMVVGTYFKAGGQVMPRAGTIKRIVGWAHSNGTSAEHKLALVMLRPAENDSTAVAPVLVDEVTWTSLGGNKLKAINETTITAAGVNAGDILMTMIKDDTGGRQVYFNITVELEV